MKDVAESTIKRTQCFILVALLIMGVGPAVFFAQHAQAAHILQRKLTITDNAAAANSTYIFSFQNVTLSNVGSITFEFCSNYPFEGVTCIDPVGLDISTLTLSDQQGVQGFSADGTSDPNKIILTRTPVPATSSSAQYTFDNIHNPSNFGSYYVQILIYPTADASGLPTDEGALAYALTPPYSVSAEVPPYLLFCVGITIDGLDCSKARGNYVDFGEFTPQKTSTAQTQLLAATNAERGYWISTQGTTLTSGNHVIKALTRPTASRSGSAQFGLNVRANTVPPVGEEPTGLGGGTVFSDYAQPNKFKFVSGEQLVASPFADNVMKYTISYIVNIAPDQPPGIYSTTLTYIGLANF